MKWQPIETAPRDGRYFLTGNFHNSLSELGEYEVARYNPLSIDEYVEVSDGLFRKTPVTYCEFTSDNFHRATHWCEIPKEPTQ